MPGAGGDGCLNFCVRWLESRLNPTCARKQTHTHAGERTLQPPAPPGPQPHTAAGAAEAAQVSLRKAEGGSWRVQVPPQVRGRAGGTGWLGDPRAPGWDRSEGSGPPAPGLREAGLAGGRRPCPAVSWGASSERGDGRSTNPRAGGSSAPALPPVSFSSPSPAGRAPFPPSGSRGRSWGRAGKGAAGASAGSALFSAAAAAGSQTGGGCAARSPPPLPGLTSSMAATVFLHWAIRVVKLEAVGDL